MPKLKNNENFSKDHEFEHLMEIENDIVVVSDCDRTLVEEILDQDNYVGEAVTVECKGFKRKFKPLWKNIESLKLFKTQRYAVIVWSHSGSEWAEAVVKSLKLQDYVDLVCSKPKFYLDDKDANEWMVRVNHHKEVENK